MGSLHSSEEDPTPKAEASSEAAGSKAAREEFSPDGQPERKARRQQSSLNWRTFLRERSGSVMQLYKKVGDLGEGAFGDVWLARQRIRSGTNLERAGRLVAIKRVRKPNPETGLDEEGADSEEALEDLRTEVELMKSLDHPSICRLLRVFEDAKNLYLVMEHIKGGELLEKIQELGSFDEDDAAQVVHQAASALSYCHARGVVHRDIKPENIMLADRQDCNSENEDDEEDACGDAVRQAGGSTDEESRLIHVKLIDFGFGCRILHGVQMRAKVGTFVYTAPEVFRGDACDEKQDTWALGCVLYVLLSGNQPFFGPDCREAIKEGNYSMDDEAWTNISVEARDLVKALLQVDPVKRLGAAEVLKQPWLVHLEGKAPQRVNAAERRALRNHLMCKLDALKSFHEQDLSKRLLAGVIARQLDESMLHKLHCTFMAMDADRNGMISFSEFKQGCKALALEGASHAQLEELFHAADLDNSGHIDYTELIASCVDRKVEYQESVCWAAFQVFDLDGNGTISMDELRKVVNSASMTEAFSSEAMVQLWKKFAGDEREPGLEDQGQGERDHIQREIDFDHFLAALRGVRAPAPETSDSGAPPAEGTMPPAVGLPLAARQRGAVSALGLPVAERRAAGGPGLPIGRPRSESAAGPGLPIGKPACSPGLPREAATSPALPIGRASAPALPIGR